MRAMRQVDLCVIGSGPGGQKAAIQAAKLCKRVCVVERRERIGGVAVHTGTIPSKALREMILRAGGIRSAAPRLQDFLAAGRTATLKQLWAYYDKVIQTETQIVEKQLAHNEIEVVYGSARFADPHTVEVIGQTATETIAADAFVIAVGSVPARPPQVPFDGVNVFTTDEIFALPAIPHSIAIVGGGVIGTEYASMLSVLGVRVTLIEGRPRLLEFVDGEITEALQYHLRQHGLALRLGEHVTTIRTVPAAGGSHSTTGQMVEVILESGKTVVADCLMYCVGRQGATEGLNLAAVGLEADARGRLKVDANYRTAVDHVCAVGDVIGFPALASTSMEQGRVAACRLYRTACDSMVDVLPYGIYSIPEIATVGRSEEDLTKAGIAYETGVAQYREIARGQLIGDEIGMLKLLTEQDTHAVLGAHAIGTGATEMIHIAQAVMALKGTADYFVDAVFNYPTLAECYRVAALNGLNKLRNA
jgi:NAD(P) transhydrogenase